MNMKMITQLLSMMNAGKNTQKILSRVTNKRRGNGGWTLISVIAVGVLALMAGRNKNMMQNMQNMFQRFQNNNIQKNNNLPMLALANMELGEEFLPKKENNNNNNFNLDLNKYK